MRRSKKRVLSELMLSLRGLSMLTLALTFTLACGGRSEGGARMSGSGGAAGASDGGLAGAGNVSGDSGVDTGTPDAKPPPGQHILFDISYQNHAWQSTLRGVFITVDGSVYSYDYFAADSGTPLPAITYPATEQEIRARYGANPVKTGSIPVKELFAHFAQVRAVASGVLLRQFLCADAGESTSIGYLFDKSTAGYSPVILGMDGDQAALNLAPEAAPLLKWLSQYALPASSCKLRGAECSGATCGNPAPSCPNHQVSSVVNGCWSTCVDVGSCVSVDDCSQCAGGMVCATAQDGSKHCLHSNCASGDACSCPVTPCAGGIAYCTTTGPLRVRCGT